MVELLHRRARQTIGITAKMAALVQDLCIDSQKIIIRVQGSRIDPDTLATLNKHLDRAIRQLQQLQNGTNGAGCVQAVAVRVLGIGFPLCDQNDLLVFRHDSFKRADRLLATDKKRHDHMWEYNNIAQRQNRKGDHGSVRHMGSSFNRPWAGQVTVWHSYDPPDMGLYPAMFKPPER